ncbi:MAG: hypothetical protein A2033_05550 [Bacteroidetes bacterium GWA2_31_9]|nr:MAG: hypothetical protein A2033_05550 [Bacteroidetes bacterium GWA2_31_9]
MKFKFLPTFLKLILKYYLLGILIFSLFRVILFVTNLSKLDFSESNIISTCFQSFIMGFRFDNLVMAYILSFPFLILSVFYVLKKVPYKFVIIFIKYFISVLLIFSFLISSIDIPYFNQFYSRLTISAMSWFDNGSFVVDMIFGDFSLWVYIFPFIIFSVLFIIASNKSIKRFRSEISTGKDQSINLLLRIFVFLFFSILIFISIRGRTSIKSPIREGTAFFCDNTFLNYLGLNPVYTVANSIKTEMKNKNLQTKLINDSDAINYLKELYGSENIDTLISPFCRKITSKTDVQKKNVVIIIMESISAYDTKQFKGNLSLTPFLDSLADSSIYFSNAYSSGIHTFNGIYSTLFSFPSLQKFHPMKSLIFEPHEGLANILKKENYYNIFFINHDEQFDNIGGFLSANGFNKIVSEKDYNSEDVKGTMGVPDHIMFKYAVNELNKVAENNNKFLSVFMTASNHKPYVLPKDIDFKPKSSNIESQMIEYSDWAISEFFKNAKSQKWFDETIFVLMGDHGNSNDGTYEIPMSYVNCPLIFYNLKNEPSVNTMPASQMDIAPSILGLLGISYSNNTMGIDLFNENRKYSYFSNEEFIGCIDNEFLFISKNETKKLYKYKSNSTINLIDSFPIKADSMQKYVFSNMQVYQWMINNKRFR